MIALALDAILVLIVIEGAAFALFHRRTGRGLPASSLWPNLAAGFLLMASVRLALSAGPPSTWLQASLAGTLALAFIAHAVDLVARWPRI